MGMATLGLIAGGVTRVDLEEEDLEHETFGEVEAILKGNASAIWQTLNLARKLFGQQARELATPRSAQRFRENVRTAEEPRPLVFTAREKGETKRTGERSLDEWLTALAVGIVPGTDYGVMLMDGIVLAQIVSILDNKVLEGVAWKPTTRANALFNLKKAISVLAAMPDMGPISPGLHQKLAEGNTEEAQELLQNIYHSFKKKWATITPKRAVGGLKLARGPMII